MNALPQAATVTELHPEPEFSLRHVVKECVDEMDAPDRDALINLVVERVGSHLEQALRQSLGKYVQAYVTEGRRLRARQALTDGSGRWAGVAEQQGSGALAIYRWWITLDPSQPAKFFGDCTVADVEKVVAAHKKQALAMADQAQRFAAVAKTMKERGAETVQDVPVERLVEIFDA